jgi:hypothetical protein
MGAAAFGDLLRFAACHPFDPEILGRAARAADLADPLRADASARLRVADADFRR